MTLMTQRRTDRPASGPNARGSAPTHARRAAPKGARRTTLALTLAAGTLLLQACGDGDEDYDFDASRLDFETAQAEAAIAANAPMTVFDPGAGQIPFPNDLLFGTDGTLDAPIAVDDAGEPLDPADPLIALNQLDGFSTVAPISAGVTEALDPGTVTLDTVHVYRVEATPQGAVTSVVEELGPTEVAVRAIGNRVVIVPVQPLVPATRYLAVLTDGIVGEDGEALQASLFYGLAKNEEPYTRGLADAGFEPVRQLTQTHLGAAASQGIDPANVVLSWTFRTQSIREPIQAAADIAMPTPLVFAPASGPSEGGLSTSDVDERFQGKANLWIGTLELPYYQTAASADDPASFQAAVNGFWRNAADTAVNPADWTPVVTTTVTVPVLMSVPNGEAAGGGQAPDGGWPVTVFQHGITQDRTNMLAIADAMADAGRVVVAIDLPMHGIVDPDSALNAANTAFPADAERHFGIDLAGVDPTAPGPDGDVDASGTHFYTPANLASSRDNLRQASADLLTLGASLPIAVVPDAAGDPVPAADAGLALNTGDSHFVGHSLGGIVGTTTLAYAPGYRSASLANPGGGIAALLEASGTIGPSIVAGLGAAGIVRGTPDYARFFVAAQTVLDSADPINHAPFLAADTNTSLHLIQVDGDDTVPNTVDGAPLSGTQPLARVLGLTRVDETTAGNRFFVRFSVGNHSTLLRPGEGDAEVAATVEMQREVANFAAGQGQTLTVNDASVITPVEQP